MAFFKKMEFNFMIYRADLKYLSAKVGKKPSGSHNSLLYDFSLGVCLWFNPSWKWGISVWPELSGIKGSVSWVLSCENAFILLRNHCAVGLWWQGAHWSICWWFFLLKQSSCANCMLTLYCFASDVRKKYLAECSACFCLHGYSQSDHK